MQRKQLLDQDEHQAGAQQVEDEPVEADIGGVVRKVADRNAMAARGESDSDQDQGGAVQPAIAQSNQVGEGKTAGDHHPDEQDFAKHVHVVLPAEIRRGQVFGKVEGEHRQDGEAAQCQGDDSGDLASTDVEGTGLDEDGGRLLQDRRRLHGTRAGRHSPAPIRLVPWRIAAMLDRCQLCRLYCRRQRWPVSCARRGKTDGGEPASRGCLRPRLRVRIDS